VPFVNVKEGFCNADGLTKPFAVMIFADESHRYFFISKNISEKASLITSQHKNIKIDFIKKRHQQKIFFFTLWRNEFRC
jgi:hypothetical protein